MRRPAPGPHGDHQLRRPYHRDQRERNDNGSAGDQDGPPVLRARRIAAVVGVARLNAGAYCSRWKRSRNEQRKADTQREPGHGPRGDADGIEREDMAEQRDQAESRQHADPPTAVTASAATGARSPTAAA